MIKIQVYTIYCFQLNVITVHVAEHVFFTKNIIVQSSFSIPLKLEHKVLILVNSRKIKITLLLDLSNNT